MRPSRGLEGGQDEAGQPPCAAQVDALKDRGHLGRCDLDAAVFCFGKAKNALLQPLHPDRKPVAIPVKNLDSIAPSVTKDEQVPGEWLLGDPLADKLSQPVKRPSFSMPLAAQTARSRFRPSPSPIRLTHSTDVHSR